MTEYNLGFISDSDIFMHVKDTVMKYRFRINLSEFNNNLIDPVKLTGTGELISEAMKSP
jgi:hypothetical protein